jgi:hypothetical protein
MFSPIAADIRLPGTISYYLTTSAFLRTQNGLQRKKGVGKDQTTLMTECFFAGLQGAVNFLLLIFPLQPE